MKDLAWMLACVAPLAHSRSGSLSPARVHPGVHARPPACVVGHSLARSVGLPLSGPPFWLA